MANIQKRIGKNGGVTYKVSVRKAGSRPIYSTFDRLSDAKEWAIQEEARLQRRINGLPSTGRYTVSQAIEKYLMEEVHNRKNEIDAFHRILGWWDKEIGSYQLRNLTPSDLERCRDLLLIEPRWDTLGRVVFNSEPRKPSTVAKYMAVLSIVFATAIRKWDGWLDYNPMLRVDKPKFKNERSRCLSGYSYHFPGEKKPRHWNSLSEEEKQNLPKEAFELPRFLEACKKQITEATKANPLRRYEKFDYHPEWLYNIVVIRISTGLRPGEAAGLKWSDINLFVGEDIGRATVGETKNGEPITIPLTGEALKVLRQMHEDRRHNHDWVFPRRDGQAPLDFRARFRRAVKDSGVEDLRPHDLRHSAASYMAMAGGTLPEIMTALNHKTPRMTKRYMHLSPEHTAGLIQRMNQAVFGEEGSTSRFDAVNDNQKAPDRKVG